MKSEQVRTAKTDCISAENQYHPIDINNWNRRDLYDHFSRLKLPHFAVAAYIDVTRLLEYKRREGLSFYLSLIYLTTEVLNGIDNFRLRIIDGQVVSFDTIHTNFTHKRPEEEVFRFHTAPYEGWSIAHVRQISTPPHSSIQAWRILTMPSPESIGANMWSATGDG